MKSDEQHNLIMSVLFDAKDRNSEDAKTVYSNTICTVCHNELRDEDCTLRDAVMKLNYQYYFEESELNRVIDIINNVK